MFMINASYSAVLTSYLTVKNDDIPIRDFDEFLRDGSYTLGVQNNTSFLEAFQVTSSGNAAQAGSGECSVQRFVMQPQYPIRSHHCQYFPAKVLHFPYLPATYIQKSKTKR